MGVSGLLPLVVAVPLLGAAALVLVGPRLRRAVSDAVGCAVAAGTAATALLALAGVTGSRDRPRAVTWLGGWRPGAHGRGVGIVLVGDPMGLGLTSLTCLLVLAVLVYSWRYLDEPPRGHGGAFPALVLLFEAGMCGFALTGDLFDAFVFFELMGVVAYALTGFRVEEPRPLQGALAFGVVGSLGGYCMLLGVALLYARTGELGLAQIGRRLDAQGRPDALVLAAFVLVTAGLLVKAAAVPFHFWLPDAHAVAPTPVCMLLSGVMVELGGYGVLRVYRTVFAGPGGVPHAAFTRTLLVVGVATALLGALMCWQQRHLKRLLAFSTVAHTGLFLVCLAEFSPDGAAGAALYVLGHAGVKAALFACTGVLLDRYASVDEHELHGRGRELPVLGGLFLVAGVALAGLPPFGTGLGKAVAEQATERTASWLPALFVGVAAVTGGAVLRAGLRIFLGAGRPARGAAGRDLEVSGDESPETETPLLRVPVAMLAVPAALLAGSLASGVVPRFAVGVGRAARLFVDRQGYRDAVFGAGRAPLPPLVEEPHWSAAGVLLGLLSAALAVAAAALAVWRPAAARLPRPVHARDGRSPAAALVAPVRRLQSGHIGDYVAWAVAGMALLTVLAAPGVR